MILKREDIEAAKTLAVVQAIFEKESAKKAWESYMTTAFPWVATAKKREVESWSKHLASEVSKGALSVTAQQEVRYRSRLKAKAVEQSALSPEVAQTVRRLSQQLPQTIPTSRK